MFFFLFFVHVLTLSKFAITNTFVHPDCKEANSDQRMMYYLNDGVYGSVSCLLNDAAHPEVEPYLHRVNIILFFFKGPNCNCLSLTVPK